MKDLKDKNSLLHRLNWSKIVVFGMMASLLFYFVINPGILGYSIYQQVERSGYDLDEYGQNIREVSEELGTTKTSLDFQTEQADELKVKVEDYTTAYFACELEKEKLKSEILYEQKLKEELEFYEGQILALKESELALQMASTESQTEKNLEACTTTTSDYSSIINQLENDYDSLSRNAAKEICCAKKFSNSFINSYTIINNKISCLENGEVELVCNFN